MWTILLLVLVLCAMVSIHSRKPHVAVVGGGWAGFGAVKTLCESGFKVKICAFSTI